MGRAVHERTFLVQQVGNEISTAVTNIVAQHELTYIELLTILNMIEARWLKSALREERHPDEPDKGADLQ
jgi:hypothetical protein